VSNMFLYIPLFFFFQAEDGIRDRNVTGVQTCALPIYLSGRRCGLQQCLGRIPIYQASVKPTLPGGKQPGFSLLDFRWKIPGIPRSEERRVGKECRTRDWQ